MVSKKKSSNIVDLRRRKKIQNDDFLIHDFTLWYTNIAGWKTTIFNRKYIDSNGGFPIANISFREGKM